MKKYGSKLYIVFFIAMLLLFLVFGFAYRLISTEYLKNLVGDNLSSVTRTVSVDLEVNLKQDYQKFIDFINNIKTVNPGTKQEVFEKALDSKSKFKINYISEYKLGYENDNSYFIEGSTYIKSRNFNESTYYKQNVSIYSLGDGFDNSSNATKLIFFKYLDYIVCFNASGYLDKVLNNISNMPENYYLITTDYGRICYQKNNNSSRTILFDWLKEENGILLEEDVDNFNKKLINQESGYEKFKFNGSNSYFVYYPLSNDLTTENFYLIYSFDQDIATSEMSYLNTTLLILFIIVFIICNISLLLVSTNLIKKSRDIESSKLRYYYAKPYIIKISRNGNIRYMNRSCIMNFDNCKRYKSVYDFDTFNNDDSENIDILGTIKSQQGFIIVMNNLYGEKQYIRMISVTTFLGYYLMGEDVTETLNEGLKNRRIALYNSVTSLPNKNILDRELQQIFTNKALAMKRRSLVALDVVNFRNINQVFGFASADNMLREVSKTLKETLVNIDATIFNIRTSLFMVLFNDVEKYNDVINWSTTAMARLRLPLNVKDNSNLISIEVKMGIFNIETDKYPDLTPKNIYESVELALDRARNSRQIKCAIYNSEIGQSLTRDQVMEQDLKSALINREFRMFFQPQYNNEIDKIVGFEALIRWNNPKYKLESPEHFISLAEKNGMIVEIGKYIMNETFRFAKSIENYNIHISMNVSPVQLLQSGFVNEMLNTYLQYSLKPGSIAVEITETFLMENSDIIIDKLKLLRDRGFSIHLDDFGIGYSSMLYLKDLPVDTIKIDKGFIRHLNTDKYSRAIVSNILQLAARLELEVIAEGVEDQKQNLFLAKNGCKIIQGYLIGKAMDEVAAVEIIKKYNTVNDPTKTNKYQVKANKKKIITVEEEVIEDGKE